MANPITWRNVSAPDFTGASRMLDRAGESFTGAFDALQNTKDTFEEGRTDRNTQAFMDELAQYRSPEELAAAQEAGTIQALRQQYGANGLIDRERTGADAITDRIGKLQQVKQQNQQYQDFNTRLGNRDALRTFNERIAARDLEGAQEIVENTDWVDPTKTAGILRDARATEFDRSLANAQETRAAEKHDALMAQTDRENMVSNATEFANSLYTQRVAAYQEADQALVGAAKELGVPIKKNGSIDYSNATREQLTALRSAAKRPSSDTQFVTRAMDRLVEKYPKLPADELRNIRAMLTDRITSNEGLLGTDQKAIQKRQSDLDESYQITTNPYYREEMPFDVSAADLVNSIPGIKDKDEGYKEDIIPDVANFLNGEVEVDGESFKVTPELMSMALHLAEEENILGWGTSVEDALEAILEDQGMQDKYNQYLEWRGKRKQVETAGKAKMGNSNPYNARLSNLEQALSKYR